MTRQLYPLGEQSFRNIREEGKVYVDKTGFIPTLLDYKYNFLNRPRRFGKSLFLSTLEQFFLGQRHLFKGLAVDSYDWEWDWEEYPVVRIDLSNGSYSTSDGVNERLSETIASCEARYSVAPMGESVRARFNNLLISLHEKFQKKVVVLVDEYEKPLLDAFGKPYFDDYASKLSDFYSVLKSNSDVLKFVFLTGVTKLGHLNIFSGLNNLTDISLDNNFDAICGITEKELTEYFAPGIERFAAENGLTYEESLSSLKNFYDGYHFSGRLTDIYNPFSLMECLRVSRLTYNWFQSGSSSFLINKLKESHFNLANLDGIKIGEAELSGIDASMNDPVTLLYQSGYLTISHYDKRNQLYTLTIPNKEVSIALYSIIIPYYAGYNHRITADKTLLFLNHLNSGDAEGAMIWLKGFFSSIPYDVKLNYESEFQLIVYAFFALIGLQQDSVLEKQTSSGRIDMVLTLRNYVYVFEFKLGESAEKAIQQINEKEYSLPWIADGREVIRIGVSFSAESRGISDFIIER